MPFRYIDFIVTGCPRSGTSYVASLLRALGFDCGHERSFDPWHMTLAEERADKGIWGDSSWLVVPYLADLPASTRVVHVVRDPVDAINSIIGTGQLDWADDYRAFIAHHWKGERDWWPDDVAKSAADFWCAWNTRIEASDRVDLRVPLEAVDQHLAPLVRLLDPTSTISPYELASLASAVPSRTNARPHLHGCPTVSSTTMGEATRALARRYGYPY